MNLYKIFFKRIIDIMVSIIALILLSPIFLILSIVIKMKLGSPIFFSQERPGKNGKIFKMHKFRTMTDAKDIEGNLLPDSERLTGFGRKLRATSLDELPELWNILKGDMSLIGPRPLLKEYLFLYNDFQKRRHDIRPGLTGWAQVNGRNLLIWNDKFLLDVYYVEHISFIFDIKIILLTIKSILKREGINSESSDTMEKFPGNKEN
ncbi:sugar transferase [Aerococcus urinaeequi]|uniref:Sugar transferase n=1 Tax=Aerococcus urinaeequi TaxID=51665 RepID=A0AAE9XR96_9LACT|nr:sugar transferase [Aerococcus urinaeequi]WCG37239.1 sugar transferase [Aerococcus urinaeequi]